MSSCYSRASHESKGVAFSDTFITYLIYFHLILVVKFFIFVSIKSTSRTLFCGRDIEKGKKCFENYVDSFVLVSFDAIRVGISGVESFELFEGIPNGQMIRGH